MRIYRWMLAALLIALCCLCAGSGAWADEEIIYPGCAHHDHDTFCGGLNNLCTHICRTCVEEIQDLIDALPALSQPITDENREGFVKQMEEIDRRKYLISDAAMEEIDFVFYELAALRLAPPYPSIADTTAYLAISVTGTGDIPPDMPMPSVSVISSAGQNVANARFEQNGRYTMGYVNVKATQYRVSESNYSQSGYTCEPRLFVNGKEVGKAPNYEARWNMTFEGGSGYVIDLVNHYTQLPDVPGVPDAPGVPDVSGGQGDAAGAPADFPQTGDESNLVSYAALALGCAMGAWLVRQKNKKRRH